MTNVAINLQCDERIPECTQCRRLKKNCPGPVTGPFFVVFSEICNTACRPGHLPITHSLTTSGHEPHSPKINTAGTSFEDVIVDKQENSFNRNPVAGDLVHGVTKATGFEAFHLLKDDHEPANSYRLPEWYQPSRAEPFDQLFFSHLFETYGYGVESIKACSWLSKLPLLMTTSFTSNAMRLSARATCMAFYSTLNGEISIQTEALKIYGKALRSQRLELLNAREIKGVISSSVPDLPSEEAICTSLMMCYFEIVTRSTPWGWLQHLDAAAVMLELRGPVNCRAPFVYQLFRTVRLGVVRSL
jgi:hypothetical protein